MPRLASPFYCGVTNLLRFSDCYGQVLPQKEGLWRVRLRLPTSRPTNEACSCVPQDHPKADNQVDFV